MSNVRDERSPAEKAAIKAERDRDAARAMQEYEAERRAVIARTAQLRDLRLAREAEAARKQANVVKKPAKARR